MPQDFLSQDIGHPHHRRAIAAAIVILIIGLILGWQFRISQIQSPQEETSVLAVPDEGRVPAAQLTQEQIKARTNISDVVQQANLSDEQIEARRGN